MKWIMGEAVRNLASGTTKPVRFTLLFSVAVLVIGLGDALTVQRYMEEAIHYRDSGAATVTVVSPGQINGNSCDKLVTIPSIMAAGALRQDDESLVSTVLPKGAIASYSVTEGALSVFQTSDSKTVGVVVSTTVANTLGVSPGQTVPLTIGQTEVRGQFDWPNDGRRPGFDFAILTPITGDELFDECWIKAWPVPENIQVLLRLVIDNTTGDTTAKIDYSQVNTSLGAHFTGVERYSSRISQVAPLLIFVVAVLLGLVMVWVRRLELATAQHVGAPLFAQAVQLLMEYGICIVIGGGIVLGIDTAVVLFLPQLDHSALYDILIKCFGCGVCGGIVGVVLAVCAISPKQLFRYFKTH